MVDRCRRRPDGVVVLFGDHGIRFDAGVSIEYFRNFFAARTPENEPLPRRRLAGQRAPTIENAYLGTELPTQPMRRGRSRKTTCSTCVAGFRTRMTACVGPSLVVLIVLVVPGLPLPHLG